MMVIVCAFFLSACGREGTDYYEPNLQPDWLVERENEINDFWQTRLENNLEQLELLRTLDNYENTEYFEAEDIGMFFSPLNEDEFVVHNFLSKEHLEQMLTHPQRRNHAEVIAERMSKYFGETVTPNEIHLYISDYMFGWVEFVGEERFQIALDYLGVQPNMFFDMIIHLYTLVAEPQGILREINQSLAWEQRFGHVSEFEVNDPQRIIAEMHMGFTDFANEIRLRIN
ncbi:MAG: hypothetical protein FWE21_01310 [Defluviitaleaceae bacterium]|nr:hypothetical protein [Defluviitaleaceae bacterium]